MSHLNPSDMFLSLRCRRINTWISFKKKIIDLDWHFASLNTMFYRILSFQRVVSAKETRHCTCINLLGVCAGTTYFVIYKFIFSSEVYSCIFGTVSSMNRIFKFELKDFVKYVSSQINLISYFKMFIFNQNK